MADEHQLMWLDDAVDDTEEEEHIIAVEPEQQAKRLEEELERTKQELQDVRKDLASKMVQLSRKEQSEAGAAQDKITEASHALSYEKEQQLQHLQQYIADIEQLLQQREEELEEQRRLYNNQKRVLKDALRVANDQDLAAKADAESSRSVVEAVAEDEIERLTQELSVVKTRAELELRSKDQELQSLRGQLDATQAVMSSAVDEARAAMEAAWQMDIDRVLERSQAEIAELQSEVLRVRAQMEEARRSSEATNFASELVVLTNSKVQVQREFEAFKEVASRTSRQNREELARLLEENGMLRARLAQQTYEASMQSGGEEGGKQPAGQQQPRLFGSLAAKAEEHDGFLNMIISSLEGQRKGLAPLVIVGCVVALFVFIAVTRAAYSARSQHQGGLCFLAKLGIRIGTGNCGTQSIVQQVEHQLEEILDQAPRVHDLATQDLGVGGGVGSMDAKAVGAAADAVIGGRRMLRAWALR